jgi:hypothetical protein
MWNLKEAGTDKSVCATFFHLQEFSASPFNKINPPLNFIRFFKTLRYFVASSFTPHL